MVTQVGALGGRSFASEGRANVDTIVDGSLWMSSCYGAYGNSLKLVRATTSPINSSSVELYMHPIRTFVDVVLC